MSLARTRSYAALGVVVTLILALLAVAPQEARAGKRAKAPTPVLALGDVPLDSVLSTDMATLPSITPYGVFVHFNGGGPAEHIALLEDHGFSVNARFDQIRVMYATGTLGDIRALTHNPSVEYIQANRALRYLGDTAPWATRVRVAQEAVSGGPYRTATSQILKGDGVGVAIVDSGIDGTHPDFAGRIVKNYKIVCSTPGLINTTTQQCFGPLVYQEASNTDTTSGHGTHVAGIVAGDGSSSEGTFTGVAPKANLYGYSTGEGLNVLYAAEAFQHIYDNFSNGQVRVINNSWGDDPGDLPGNGPAYDPNDVISKLTKLLVGKGVTVAFAAGNSNNDNNNQDRTSSYCKDPTPGVICVASYNDANTGNRDNVLSTFSSKGRLSPTDVNAAAWPDISAPGQSITSTCGPNLPVCGPVDSRWAPRYGTISGTSMAAPHIAGAAALLYQARPGLTPAQVEDVLQDTAHRFTAGGPYRSDPQNLDSLISHDKGAGLLDLRKALDALGVAHDGTGGGSGTPSIAITEPADQSTHDGNTVVTVSGTANDGEKPTEPPLPQLVFNDPANDSTGQGSLDILSFEVQEMPTGLEYRVTVRDPSDLPPTGVRGEIRLLQNVDGKRIDTSVTLSSTGVVAPLTTSPNPATSASITGNRIVFFVPFSNLGNPPSNAPAHNVRVITYIGLAQDVGPGGPGHEVDTKPRFAFYTVSRPSGPATPPTAKVELSVDGGAPTVATLSGTSPSYTWTSSVNTMTLTDGPHTLTATLKLNEVVKATSIVTINVVREPVYTDDIGITSPADGSTVPRALVEVRGFSSSDRPDGESRSVTLQVQEVGGPYGSNEVTATGTSPWTQDVNFGALDPGDYTLTARLYVGGIERSVDMITVTVPEPVVYTHEVAIASPASGAEVPRSNVTIMGTSSSTAPPEQSRQVTVQVHNASYDSGHLVATGTEDWSRAFNFGALDPGTYTVTARLFVNGIAEALHEISVTVPSEQTHTHSIEITSPSNGATVPRSAVTVTGTSATTSSESRTVKIEIHRTGYSSGELTATGTNNWTRSFNFDTLDPGAYTLTARLYVGGTFAAIHSITVNVPDPTPTGQVSCAGRGKGWWKQQYEDNGKSQKFTDAEADTLAQHAADLSSGYFTKSVLIQSLSWQGNVGSEKRAARHFATLLLNLAAGDLSATMSVQVGLSGNEVLDPAKYDTSRVGGTVQAAANWVRAQFPNGDHGGANDVAEAINEGIGLKSCGG